MAYIVKYIGNCARNNTDIRPLYQQDIANGHRVVLVCEKATSAQYFGDNIKLIDSPVDAAHTDASLMLLRPDKDAKVQAVETAFSLYAQECQVYIRYDGIYTADPDENSFAQRLDRIDYDEVAELYTIGYNGVDIDMVEVAKKRGVILHMLSYNQPEGKGTIIKEVMAFGSSTVKGIIKEPDICIVSLREIPDVPGISYFIFNAVSEAGINVDMISLPASDYGKQDISFTIHKDDKRAVQKVLGEKQAELGYSYFVIKDNVAKISVVGAGVKTSRGVAASVFRILYENNISLRLISTSEIKISVLVDKNLADLAVQKIHEYFIR